MCLYVSSQLGTSVGNHCSKGHRARLDTWGSGREGPGWENLSASGWGSGSLGQRKFHNPPSSSPRSTKGATHAFTGDVEVTPDPVPSDCPHTLFHQLKRLEVKLETPDNISQPHPTSPPGTAVLSQKPLFSSLKSIDPSPQSHPILPEVTLLHGWLVLGTQSPSP